MTVDSFVIASAVALCATPSWAAYVNTDRCLPFDFAPKPCSEKLSAEGWRREFTLPSKTDDAGIDYDVWRKGRETILCSTNWGRARPTTMTCDLFQPVPAKN